MQIFIAAIGRCNNENYRLIFEEYQKRIAPHFSITLKEIIPKKAMTECQAMMEIITSNENAMIVALDSSGVELNSVDFSRKILSKAANSSYKRLVFMIGGASGHDPAILAHSTISISFGSMTWSHMMARIMLAEQLYRATTIFIGHPYHGSH